MTMVFVHGSGATHDHWRYQLGLADTVALDLPGHPRGQGMQSVADYARWLHDELGRRGLERPILVGHSLGGAVVQQLALDHPGRARALGLVGTGARLRVTPGVLDLIRADFAAAAPQFMGFAYAAGADEAEKARDVARMIELGADVSWGDLHACDEWDVMQRLGEITVPALVVCGTEDRLTPVKYARYLADHLPDARLVTIEGAGHMVMVERPAEVNAALVRFRDELDARERG